MGSFSPNFFQSRSSFLMFYLSEWIIKIRPVTFHIAYISSPASMFQPILKVSLVSYVWETQSIVRRSSEEESRILFFPNHAISKCKYLILKVAVIWAWLLAESMITSVFHLSENVMRRNSIFYTSFKTNSCLGCNSPFKPVLRPVKHQTTASTRLLPKRSLI